MRQQPDLPHCICPPRHLSPGGLLIVEVAHPGDLFDGSMTNPDVLGSDRWEQTGAGSAPGVKSLEVSDAWSWVQYLETWISYSASQRTCAYDTHDGREVGGCGGTHR